MEDTVEIIPFDSAHAKHFTQLNIAWIKKYFVVEPKDEEVLGDPQQFIIDKGGHVFFAKLNEQIVGTFALVKDEENAFELGKMAVAEDQQGKNIGNKMIGFCLKEAKALGADKVILYSNTILKPAIHLYEKFGFKEVPLHNSVYKRSNIKMEIHLKK